MSAPLDWTTTEAVAIGGLRAAIKRIQKADANDTREHAAIAAHIRYVSTLFAPAVPLALAALPSSPPAQDRND